MLASELQPGKSSACTIVVHTDSSSGLHALNEAFRSNKTEFSPRLPFIFGETDSQKHVVLFTATTKESVVSSAAVAAGSKRNRAKMEASGMRTLTELRTSRIALSSASFALTSTVDGVNQALEDFIQTNLVPDDTVRLIYSTHLCAISAFLVS